MQNKTLYFRFGVKSLLLVAVLAGLMPSTVLAQIRIEKPAGEKVTIQLAGLQAGDEAQAREFMQALRTNLDRSGWFEVVPAGRGEVAVSGRTRLRGNELQVEASVVGTVNRQQYINQRYRQPAADARRMAQRLTDDIVEAVIGYQGIASTQIIFVGAVGRHRELFLISPDGGGLRQLTSDGNWAVSPRWGPTRRQVTYTGYLNRFADVFLVNLETGDRRTLSAQSGLNAGGVISPNGEELALVLSKDGNPELYVKNLQSGRLTRLTNTPNANEASPSWSPDGQEIVYVSDQVGRPHLYIISRRGGAPRRVTTRGSENVAPDWGRNGLIAFSHRIGRQNQIGILDPESGQISYISDSRGADYEDPSWAPNGRHLVVGRRENFRSDLYILDTAGDPPLRLTTTRGDWFTPAWSPQ